MSHLHNLMTLITVPVYQLTILLAYSEACKVEELAALVKCSGMSFSTRRSWMYVEILGFFVNMAVLMFFSLSHLCRKKIGPGLQNLFVKCCRRKKIMKRVKKDEESKPDVD